MTLEERAEKIAAESEAKKAAEAKETGKPLGKLVQRAKARLQAKEDARKEAERQVAQQIKAENDAEIRRILRSRFPGTDKEFDELYPELRRSFLISETLKPRPRNSFESQF
ncbi:MAG TPA: hypothetical protein VFC63_07590 [Blastocatellia bacterium]|nr:hypothetical protein [Blastocatellia bacterium]